MEPQIALSQHAHGRIAHRRVDDDWLDAAWASQQARVLVVAGTRLPLTDGGLTWVAPAQAPAGTRVLLGERDSVVYFAVIADGAAYPEAVPIRFALPFLGAEAELVVHAIGLAEWHWSTRHCPRCGGALHSTHQGHVLRCAACEREQFPRTDPAVIMLITRGEGDAEQCLLGRRPGWPPGQHSTLAGFVEPGESLEHAVRREVLEESGITVGEVSYVGSQPWPLPASLMLGFFGRATGGEIVVDGEELESARWFTRAEMAAEGAAGSLRFPPGVSISRTLIQTWYGEALPE